MDATVDQIHQMAITERVVSCFSVVGILFILSTYTFSAGFSKPINRLVFFASWGNLGMNVAALISESGPASGSDAPLCQLQGFLIQMFLGVDAYWSLCMALNVYLVFFRRYNVKQLRGLDIRYLLACYGLAFVPSLVFLFISTDSRGKMYGDAVLWCWITVEWAFMRIALVYSISWVAIALALVVYFMAGYNVWKRRADLQGNLMNPFNENPLKSVVVTEIQITSEPRKPSFHVEDIESSQIHTDYNPYSVDIKVGPQNPNRPARPALLQMGSLTRSAAKAESNTQSLLYARSAFFYFIALLIVWVPASVNRAYSLMNPDEFNFPLNYLSALLLSSQGFLNVIVYVLTSRTAVVALWVHVKSGLFIPKTTKSEDTKLSQRRIQRLNSFEYGQG